MRGYQRLVNKTCQENACIATAIALKGLNEIAQGNALGKCAKKPSPERAKGVVNRLLRPFRACLMGDEYPGLRSASTPGYLISPLRGLRAAFIFPSFPRRRESRDTSCKEWIPAYARMTKARGILNTLIS